MCASKQQEDNEEMEQITPGERVHPSKLNLTEDEKAACALILDKDSTIDCKLPGNVFDMAEIIVPRAMDLGNSKRAPEEVQAALLVFDIFVRVQKPPKDELISLFHQACRNCSLALAKHLRDKHSVDPNDRKVDPEYPPLYHATHHTDNMPIIEWLINECGQDPHEALNGYSGVSEHADDQFGGRGEFCEILRQKYPPRKSATAADS